jgi:16S rRNA G966 N2-methylase RsmD
MLINDPQHDIEQSHEIIAVLKNAEAMAFVHSHLHEPAEELALKYRGKVDFDLTKLTQILQLYARAKHKRPLWVDHKCAMHSKAYEQCTHAEVAAYKASLFTGKTLLDLTSGLGVDDYYLSLRFESVIALESDLVTAQMAAYNHEIMGRKNIDVIHTRCEDFDLNGKSYDVIYVDPDRRPTTNTQVRAVDEYHPNIFEHYTTWLEHADRVAIKLSPMTDLHLLEAQLESLKEILVISYRNEVKEVLAILQKDVMYKGRTAVDIGHSKMLSFSTPKKELTPPNIHTGGAIAFVMEPGRAIIKAQLSEALASRFELKAFMKNGLYFSGDKPLENFPGRQFEVIQQLEVNWKSIKKTLKTNKISAINVAQRNFYDDVRNIRKKLGIAEGGTDFLLFTQDQNGRAICVWAKPISTSL